MLEAHPDLPRLREGEEIELGEGPGQAPRVVVEAGNRWCLRGEVMGLWPLHRVHPPSLRLYITREDLKQKFYREGREPVQAMNYLKLSSTPSVVARLRVALEEEVHGQGLYQAFAVRAREEGRPDAEAAFAFIAEQEGEHARKFLELLGEGVLPETDPPTMKEGRETGDTRANLRYAVADEQEAQKDYGVWADKAEEAREYAAMTALRDAIRDERFHELTFQRLLEEAG